MREILQSKGISSPVRRVAVIAPLNVWRHLGKFDSKLRIDLNKASDYVLFCLKPIYGLNDAPLAWQLCLRGHFEEQGGRASLLDENMFFWKDGKGVKSMVTTHVDDIGATGETKWLKEQHELLVSKFGKVSRQGLPFVHCGIEYSRASDGYFLSQDSFASKLKQVDVPAHRKDSDILHPAEVTSFRSILGGLLWLTATKLDLIADVCLLQSQVTRARVEHLRQANGVVKRAQSECGQGLGLHYRRLRGPLRVLCIHDSSAAGSTRSYAQEGVLVLLCEDHLQDYQHDYEHELSAKVFRGKAHILWAHGAKAKRISYSTSHAETLAAISGLEASAMIMVRLAELHFIAKPTIQSLLAAQEHGLKELPVDDCGDCRDLYELCSGSKGIAQDKNQRLYVLALREARMMGRICWLIDTDRLEDSGWAYKIHGGNPPHGAPLIRHGHLLQRGKASHRSACAANS